MQNGKKFKTNHGEIRVTVQALLETDHKHEWRNHPFLKGVYELFWRRIFWKNMESHKQEVLTHANDLHERIKKYFELFTTQTDTRSFRPVAGIGEKEPIGPKA